PAMAQPVPGRPRRESAVRAASARRTGPSSPARSESPPAWTPTHRVRSGRVGRSPRPRSSSSVPSWFEDDHGDLAVGPRLVRIEVGVCFDEHRPTTYPLVALGDPGADGLPARSDLDVCVRLRHQVAVPL